MARLADKLAKANDAVAGIEHAVDRDVDALIERTKAVHAKREAVFLKKHAGLDQHITDLATFETDLDDFGKNDRSGDGESSDENSGSAYVGTAPKV